MLVLEIIVAVVLIGLVINAKAVKDMLFAGKAQIGKVGRAVSGADPLANYQQRIDDEAEKVKKAKDPLDKVGAMVRRLRRQVSDGTRQKNVLDFRIKDAISKGNDAEAGKYAMQMKEVETHLQENNTQLQQATETFDTLMKQIEFSRKQISILQQDAQQLGMQVETANAQKELSSVMESIPSDLGLSDLSKEREAVLNTIDHNLASVENTRALNQDKIREIEMQEASQRSEADALVAEYKAKMQKPQNV